jgi:TRAP-type C4-dicarboxylate transport system permease small subunit
MSIQDHTDGSAGHVSAPPSSPEGLSVGDGLMRALSVLARAMALAGGLLLATIILVSFVSIAGRVILSVPVLGDFEIIERATGISVCWFLPYCQLANGHVVVDFVTRKLSRQTRDALDMAANAALGLVVLFIAARTATGAADLHESGEITMILGMPSWISVALMVPGLAVFGLCALAMSARLAMTMIERSR